VSGLGLAACGGSSSSASGPVTLTVWQCGSSPKDGCLGPRWPALVAAFEKANPSIKIKTRYVPFTSLDSVFAQAFAAGSGPDIADVNSSGEYGLFASKGYLKDLSSKIVGLPNIVASDFYPTLWQQAALKQGTFGIPVDTGTRALFWNKLLFKKAGVQPFGKTVTWSQVVNAAQKVSALGNGISGFRYAGGEKWAMLYNNIGPLVFEAGGQFIDPTAGHAYATSPAVAHAVNYWNQLIRYAPRSDVSEQDQSVAMQAFATNKAGMYYNGFWEIPQMRQLNAKVQFGEALMKDQTVASATGGWLLAVPSFVSDSKMAAIEKFFSFVYRPSNEAELTNIMPALKSATPYAKAIQGPEYNIFWHILNTNARQPIPLTANMSQEAVDIFQAVQATTLGGSVSSTMNSLQSQLEKSLSG
jgi:ABC-type glycerol-3-phosphate transport system substrate-binding protein